ncbi:hypothetical protein WJX75_006135 [Coccomyxa subellipsoidea]|uniref:Uncharacterized protein n=1 Tax=Coccomyxa subellipsoidea TaxID=248742 RepID=A0ABR2YAS3_9CHLO
MTKPFSPSSQIAARAGRVCLLSVAQTRRQHVPCVADGKEHAILRQSAKYAFGYELLYDWAAKTSVGGAPWFTFWRDTLQRYAGVGVDVLRRWMDLRSVFQSATLNFIELQWLDYDSGPGGFCCGHDSGVTADGITLGYHLEQAHLESPYLAAEDSSVVAGSTFSSRIFHVTTLLEMLLKVAKQAFMEAEPDTWQDK